MTTSYSNQRIVDTAFKRGHEAELIVFPECQMIGRDIQYRGRTISQIDYVIPRIMPDMSARGIEVVQYFEKLGVKTTSSSTGIALSRNKLYSARALSDAGVPVPKIIEINKRKFIEFPIIIKALEGTQGDGVWLIKNAQELDEITKKLNNQGKNFLAQEFIKEAKGSDVRAFVIDGKVVGAMLRQAQDGEFRSNTHLGARATKVDITDLEAETAVRACKAMGLKIGGVDILRSSRGPLVLEVNSSPGFEALESATGIDIAEKIIEYVEQNAKTQSSKDRVGA